MTNLYHEAVLPTVVALCVIVKSENSVVEPVVPKFCERLCNETARCHAFDYKASDLSCHLISEKDVERMDAENNMICPNDMYNIKLKKQNITPVSISTKKGSKKKKDKCRRKHCKPPDKLKIEDEQSRCVLYRQENITNDPDQNSKIVTLPLIVKPGMKLKIYGGYMSGEIATQISFTRDSYHKAKSTNPLTWSHVVMNWIRKTIAFTEGLFKKSTFDGDFPITDPAHFTVEVELTHNLTKIYVENVLVRTVRPFLEIPGFYLHRFGRVYYLEVQKTGKGCDETDKNNR